MRSASLLKLLVMASNLHLISMVLADTISSCSCLMERGGSFGYHAVVPYIAVCPRLHSVSVRDCFAAGKSDAAVSTSIFVVVGHLFPGLMLIVAHLVIVWPILMVG